MALLLHLQPRVNVLLTGVLVGTHSWAVCVSVTMAVIVFMVMCVCVGAATVGVLTRVSVSRFCSAMVGCVASPSSSVTRTLMVLSIHHNALELRPGC